MTLLTRIRKSGLCRIPVSLLASLLLILPPGLMQAGAPGWWEMRGVLKAGAAPDDYAAINQGQLKNLVRAAADEMDEKLPGGAGTALHDLVAGWAHPTVKTDDYAAVNLGQLKAMAKPVYVRLIAIGYFPAYPWAGSSKPADDYAMANIGQAKNLFARNFFKDSDGDGLPDTWELLNGLNPYDPHDALSDYDGDGRTAFQEFLDGTDPLVADNVPPLTTPPAAPSNVKYAKRADGSILVTWNDNSNNEDYFIIRMRGSDGVMRQVGRTRMNERFFIIPAPQ